MNHQTPLIHVAARRRRWPIAGLCALLLASASQAQNSPTQPTEESTMWLAASNHTLDHMRGGFDFGSGLFVSFGISRAVYINDHLVTTMSLQLGDIAKLTPAQAAVLGQQIASQMQVVQNGPGNTVETGAVMVPLATYIQNTLNNQTIRNQTVIQAATNGLGILKSLNLQSTISQAIANAIGNH